MPLVDLFKKDGTGNPIWVDAVADLEAARKRLIQLASALPGEYFAFDQRKREIVASFVRLAADAA